MMELIQIQMKTIIRFTTFRNYCFLTSFVLVALFFVPSFTLAATMSVSPNTGVYVAGKTFTVRVVVNTDGKPVNAAEGTLKFNPQELTVVSVDKSNSIFNLWVTEPTFSNSAGTITFSGGMPSGYTGSAGTIFNVTFRTTSASTARVSMTSGSVLANDGMGTNVLSGMNGGTFTIQAPTSQPVAEVVEYVAPANTPGAPVIQSATHKDEAGWSNQKNATLSWNLPNDITAVRTSLDNSKSSIPTKVYDNPISNITLNDLSEGVSYFHIQFKNADGWGKVSHYRLGIDSQKPASFVINQSEDNDFTNPIQTLKLETKDETSGVNLYKIKIDNQEVYDYFDEEEKGLVQLPTLLPGYHSIIIEAFDRAGNSIIASNSFTILAFDRPTFTEYPREISEEVIPVIKGLTRPDSQVEISVQKIGTEPTNYILKSNKDGIFIFIPEGKFTNGVYELSARSTDQFGAKSEISETIRIAVQQPGYVRIGNFLVNLLSVVIPLIAMSALLLLFIWFLIVRMKGFKKKLFRESSEAHAILSREFTILHEVLQTHEADILNSRKTKKLTKAEVDLMIAMKSALNSAQANVEKEISDVEEMVQKKHK